LQFLLNIVLCFLKAFSLSILDLEQLLKTPQHLNLMKRKIHLSTKEDIEEVINLQQGIQEFIFYFYLTNLHGKLNFQEYKVNSKI